MTLISKSIFSAKRLNPSTFVVLEDDKFDEHPFIYIKILSSPSLVIITDTGCGGKPNDKLRSFLETHPVPANNFQPLNPSPTAPYLLICTHCHYDHILGLPEFTAAPHAVLASSHDMSFLAPSVLAAHSLCKFIPVPTPRYKVDIWAADIRHVRHLGHDVGVQALHTPGHTPDSLAWYDASERWLYVGDSFYNRVSDNENYTQAIIFPKEGSLLDFRESVEKMLRFVLERNDEEVELEDVQSTEGGKKKKEKKPRVRLGCGHTTAAVDGEEMLLEVRRFFRAVVGGEVRVQKTFEKRGVEARLWQEEGNPRFSLEAPTELVEEARREGGWVEGIKSTSW